MPDQDLIDYIRENKSKYGVEALKRGLLKQGVSNQEIKEAIEFVENEEEDKISKFLEKEQDLIEEIEEEIDELEEDILAPTSFSKKEYIAKANHVIGAVTDVFGIAKRDKKVYIDAFKYGALAFLFLTLITILFRYFGGRVVAASLMKEFGTSWTLHFPNTFWLSISIINFKDFFGSENPHLFSSVLWGLIIGGVITFLFIRFLTNVWPFNIWPKLSQKIFYFYLFFNLIFGFLFNISFAEFSFRHFLGYLLVLIGIVGGSYLASNYFVSVMESRHNDKIRSITLKID